MDKYLHCSFIIGQVFVTHCGNNGQYEAVFHGVPMVGLPIFGDQPHSAFRMQEHGYGVSLLPDDLATFSVLDLVTAIREVITNPKYRLSKVQYWVKLELDEALGECRPYWLRQIITPILHNMKNIH